MPALEQAIAWLQDAGPVGLFLAAILDALLPMAGVADAMVVVLSYSNRDPVTYALVAGVGSTAGYVVLFSLVRRFGSRFATRLITSHKLDALHATLERFGVPMIAVGALMPPPFPLKGLVLAAGLARMRLLPFAAGLMVARLFRFGLESSLAVVYGEQALVLMKLYYVPVGLGVVTVLLAGWLIGQRLTRTTRRVDAPQLEASPVETRLG